MWIHQLLMEVGIEICVPTKLLCDNQAAMHMTPCHFVCEKFQLGLISIGYVPTRKQLRDIFTKPLSGDRVSYLCNKLGMINIYTPT